MSDLNFPVIRLLAGVLRRSTFPVSRRTEYLISETVRFRCVGIHLRSTPLGCWWQPAPEASQYL